MEETPERKTVSLTHRQIGTTGLIGLAVALAPYLKETFVTREDGARVAQELQYVKQTVADLKVSIDKLPEQVDVLMKENMKQVRRDSDRLEKRVENLEVYAFRNKRSNNL